MSKKAVPKHLAGHLAFKQLKALKRRRKARLPKLPSCTPKLTEREEWAMFKDCPETELQGCLQYELAREVDWIRKAVENYSDNNDGVMGFRRDCRIRLSLAFALFHVRRFFPKTPWLGIPPKDRWWPPAGRPMRRELHLDDWERVQRIGGASVEKLKREGINDYRDMMPYTEGGSPVTYSVLRVNWHKTNGVLLAEFGEWLEKYRATLGVKPIHTQGKTSPRDTLKALGAMRWLKCCSCFAAQVETEDILKKPLYSGKGAWDNALAKAKQAIGEFLCDNDIMGSKDDEVFCDRDVSGWYGR